ncbi:HNH endonuclease [Bacillus sp. FJAT-49711]|uniref:HNH endonuclease n=1 Tax=Bacillus sp. FJAT-49711 TaxID=2833585 RepID=UPI001BC8CC3D|nr:HNH endonuclease domain-containing protein [Bacillus sp. FJAT-49711]MBS4218330.1 HNH endonuclease [Bacillus sp. FJAT-49711]
MSHKLKVGELNEQYMTDEEIWRVFTVVLSSKSAKSSTYKYVLMKSIIENLYQINDQYGLTYNQLAYSFAKIYWNLVVHHNLVKQNRGPKSARAVTVIQEFQQKHVISSEFSFDKIQETLQLKLVSSMKSVMKENVFGALYGDTKGQFYAFDHKLEVFRLHPVVHQFMLRYQRLLVNLVNYHMAVMIEELNENKCFYCGKSLSERKGNIHVDHFIPWSFVQSDQIWNLVLACRTCNLAKSDKVPRRPYLDIIIDRNEQLYHMPNESTQLMENYKDKKVILLYNYSIENGFDTLWAPR